MLPGFRFLVAAIVVSLSVLVFGLGAAALLRAAHEQFASNASWRATPETSYTTFLPPAEPSRPMLALLRIDPVPPPQPATDLQPSPTPAETPASVASTPSPSSTEANTTPAAASPPTQASPSPEPAAEPKETLAAAQETPDTQIAASAKPENPPPDNVAFPQVTASPAPAVEMVPDPPKATSAPSADIQPLVAPVASTAPASSPSTVPVKLAALGGQPVATESKASVRTAGEQLHQSLEKKRVAKQRAKEKLAEAKRKRRRRMLQQARAARQVEIAKQQQLNDPFGQPQQQSLTTATTTLSTPAAR